MASARSSDSCGGTWIDRLGMECPCVRAQVATMREREFVLASQLLGRSHLVILCTEILPTMASLLLSAFIGATIYAIGAQVGLEFLGLGDIGKVTWGTNLYWASNDAALCSLVLGGPLCPPVCALRCWGLL